MAAMGVMAKIAVSLLFLALCVGGMGRAQSVTGSETQSSDAEAIANSLATMLQAARSVISDSQPLINDPSLGNKGLTGKVVLERTLQAYRAATGSDPLAGDPESRAVHLLRDQMDAIVEVVDANQETLNAEGTAFKGFIPAVFARLVNEAFARRAGDEARVKAVSYTHLTLPTKA